MGINLPDFDEVRHCIETIKELSLKKALLDIKIKEEESRIVREVTNNQVYYVGGKPPSMSFIESTYLIDGLPGDNTLKDLKTKFAHVSVELEYNKLLLEFYNKVADVWRTMTANERAGISIYDKT